MTMAKNANTRKLLNARSKGLIALILLLAITVIVSCLSITGMHYGEDGVNVLLPWVPASAKNWPEALNPSRALGGGSYILFDASVAEGESLEDYLANKVFADSVGSVVEPKEEDVAGFTAYIENYKAGIAVEKAAIAALR